MLREPHEATGLSTSLSDADNGIYYATQSTDSNGEASFPNVEHVYLFYSITVDNSIADYQGIFGLNYTSTTGTITSLVPY
ncbi:MAG: hypothetical protein JKY54_04970 [Flavobacteriales bacterium]|nr:hypothetical protein [Flavobacteriales bacterium]